ncbi:hypothetical protein D9757_004185 [Collybiopsis confluens]|uniref:Malate dehydrogenase n=1 Tax=Collybiopsis confluens TaxID=2823264 RepID=A0A8H5HUB1_9AGAR|nr:hypothetical protein D9757_004185 [Collybiopsis confluens]
MRIGSLQIGQVTRSPTPLFFTLAPLFRSFYMMLHSIKTITVLASLACACVAAPASRSSKRCNLSTASMDIPSGVALPVPTYKPTFLGLGVGTQNYTCTSAGTYTSAGALAELYDVSCMYGSPAFEDLPAFTYSFWNHTPASVSPSELISLGDIFDSSMVLGQHYFVTNPITGSGISPKWDFTSRTFPGNPEAFVVGSKLADVPAPTGKLDVDWLKFSNATGDLANEVYRVDTRGGQPPASCVPGSAGIYVKYVALYWFMGGSF